MPFDNREVLGVHLTPISRRDLTQEMVKILEDGRREVILPVNAHFVNLAHTNPWLRTFVRTVRYVTCDGAGLLLATRVLGNGLPEQIRFLDWVHDVFEVCEKKGYSLYFLGADEATVKKAEVRMKTRYPELRIVGSHHGYFVKSGKENEKVIEDVIRANPDVLLTGFSMPLEEQWLSENRDRLNVKLVILGSGCYENLSGKMPSCPTWLSRLHLEWLFRLMLEPRRLFWRYVVGNPLFIARILVQRLQQDRRAEKNTAL